MLGGKDTLSLLWLGVYSYHRQRGSVGSLRRRVTLGCVFWGFCWNFFTFGGTILQKHFGGVNTLVNPNLHQSRILIHGELWSCLTHTTYQRSVVSKFGSGNKRTLRTVTTKDVVILLQRDYLYIIWSQRIALPGFTVSLNAVGKYDAYLGVSMLPLWPQNNAYLCSLR